MVPFFDPTPDAVDNLDQIIAEVTGIQQLLCQNSGQLKVLDRGAHEFQIAGGKVLFSVAQQLPPELTGLGLFASAGQTFVGLGRISTGMGCPHAETDPDFLGIMFAFRSRAGQRIDFIGINDPSAPTNSVADFMALLKATADAAVTGNPMGAAGVPNHLNMLASQFPLVRTLVQRLGPFNALTVLTHVSRQTSRTTASSSAVQTYWTGIVDASGTLGKFTIVPKQTVNQTRPPAPATNYLSQDWQGRQSAGDLEFGLFWIPYLNDQDTPSNAPINSWKEDEKVQVGSVVFPRIDPQATESKLLTVLAMEMGANPGNWVGEPVGSKSSAFPATEYTAGRFLAYSKSQQGRNALPQEEYDSYFEAGQIDPKLASELVARYQRKKSLGHTVPALGDINLAAHAEGA